MLAALDGNLIFLLIMAAIGLINWLTKKAETSEQNESPPKTGQPGTLRPRPPVSSEEERMRKFLEALGVPAGQAPPPVKRPEAPPVTPRPLPKLEPKPPFVAGPLPVPRSKPRPFTPVPPPLPPREAASQDQRPAPTLPVEQLHLATLETPEVKEFVTTSSTISATNQRLRSQENDAYTITPEAAAHARSESIRELLSSPASLRNAVLLREVLGPPRGLPSAGALPTFP